MIVRLCKLSAVLSLLLLQACTTSSIKSADMRAYLLQGQTDRALFEVEKNAKADDVMANMNRGLLYAMQGRFEKSNQALQQAKEKIEDLYTISLTEQTGAALINDEVISFDGDRYEQVLVHAYKALNYIALDDVAAARVEVLQSDVKMMEWGEIPEEDPFIRYLSGIIFEALGEEDEALVMYRRAVKVYQSGISRHGLAVPEQLKFDLLRLLSKTKMKTEYERYQRQFSLNNWSVENHQGMGEVIVLLHNGLVPQREQITLHSWASELAARVIMALPAYPRPAKKLNVMRVSVAGKTQSMQTVENLDALARSALDENIALITSRAIARAVIKKKTENKAAERNGAIGRLTMMVLNSATEIADTRCWNTLPQEIQIARIFLPEGRHELKIDVFTPSGAMVDSLDQTVDIKKAEKTIISQFWSAPKRRFPLSTPVSAVRY